MPRLAPHLHDPESAWAEAERRVELYIQALCVDTEARQQMVASIMEHARAHEDEVPLVAAMREVHAFLTRQVVHTQGVIPADQMSGSAAWRVALWRHTDYRECTWRAVPDGALHLSQDGRQFIWRGGSAMPQVRRAVISPAEIRPAPEGFLSRLLGLNEGATEPK